MRLLLTEQGRSARVPKVSVCGVEADASLWALGDNRIDGFRKDL